MDTGGHAGIAARPPRKPGRLTIQMTAALTRLATLIMGAAVLIALISAFLGITVSDLWYDEIYTALVIGRDHDVGAMLGRAFQDVHPPLYYLAMFGFTELFGASDFVFRLFSAICAVSGVVLFIGFARGVASLPARLFGATIGVVSHYWRFQAQNARSYGLCLLLVTILMIVCLAIVDRARRGLPLRWCYAAFASVTLLGAFIHFYMLIVALAAMAVLFVIVPAVRVAAVVWGVLLTGAVFTYIRLVVRVYSTVLLDHNWIGSNLSWYTDQLLIAVSESLPRLVIPSLAICLGVALWRSSASWRGTRMDELPARRSALWLGIGVPLMTIIGGIASSILVSPNFTATYILLASPFLWMAYAVCYDRTFAGFPSTLRNGLLTLLLTLPLLATATRVNLLRFEKHSPLYRESAAWIARQPNCSAATIPVLFNRTSPMRPGALESLVSRIYGYYLPRPLTTKPVEIGGVPMIASTPDGCAVVGWGAFYITKSDEAATVGAWLARVLHTPIEIHEFRAANDTIGYSAAFVFVRR